MRTTLRAIDDWAIKLSLLNKNSRGHVEAIQERQHKNSIHLSCDLSSSNIHSAIGCGPHNILCKMQSQSLLLWRVYSTVYTDAQAQNTHTFTFLTLHMISLSLSNYIYKTFQLQVLCKISAEISFFTTAICSTLISFLLAKLRSAKYGENCRLLLVISIFSFRNSLCSYAYATFLEFLIFYLHMLYILSQIVVLLWSLVNDIQQLLQPISRNLKL